jgi:hypothetical protein
MMLLSRAADKSDFNFLKWVNLLNTKQDRNGRQNSYEAKLQG